jgi:hypothetical protein
MRSALSQVGHCRECAELATVAFLVCLLQLERKMKQIILVAERREAPTLLPKPCTCLLSFGLVSRVRF